MPRNILVVGFSNYFNGNGSNPFGFDLEVQKYTLSRADTLNFALTYLQSEKPDLILTNYNLRYHSLTQMRDHLTATATGLDLLMLTRNSTSPRLMVSGAINPLLAKKVCSFGAHGIYEFPIVDQHHFAKICDELITTKQSPTLEHYMKTSPLLHEPDLQS